MHARMKQAEFELELLRCDLRAFLADRYIHGEGIEIGAAHRPLKVPAHARVTYVDTASTEDLRKLWPEVAKMDLAEVSIVDDGETLSKIADGSQDFVVANHFLEHCLDPIGVLKNMKRVLKDDGMLFMAIPNKRHTFDVDRPVTPYPHLIEEHGSERDKFLRDHTHEYVRLAEKFEGDTDIRVNELIASEYRIHYHVWTELGLAEMLANVIRDFKLPFEIQTLIRNNDEVIVVLQKVPRESFD